MPVRSHGLALAGMAVVLVACTASMGCHSAQSGAQTPEHGQSGEPAHAGGNNANDAYAIRANTEHPPKRIWSLFRSRDKDKTATVKAPAPGTPNTFIPATNQGQAPAPTSAIAGYPPGTQIAPMAIAPQNTQGTVPTMVYPQGPALTSPAAYSPQVRPVGMPTAPMPYATGAPIVGQAPLPTPYTAGAAASPQFPPPPPGATAPAVSAPSATPPAAMSRPAPGSVPSADPPLIASSFQPVQHLALEPAGPELNGVDPHRHLDLRPVPTGRPATAGFTPPGATVAISPAGTDREPPVVGTPDAEETLPAPRIMPRPVTPQPATQPVPDGALVVEGFPTAPVAHGHGAFHTPGVPKEFQKQALPDYVVEPPDILLIQASEAVTSKLQPIQGQHLVRPDGKIHLGIYGELPVAGMTVGQVRDTIAQLLLSTVLRDKRDTKDRPFTLEQVRNEVDVDVIAFNSKYYYIITDGGGYGAAVYRLPITGNETVLDALAQVNGLPTVASKKCIWLARATPDGAAPKVMPVDWCGLVKKGSAATNYQIYPNDRIYVESDALIRTDTKLAKVLSPIQRVFGATLLGASTVNTIRNSGGGGGGGGAGNGFGTTR